jgi:hypothetical protein
MTGERVLGRWRGDEERGAFRVMERERTISSRLLPDGEIREMSTEG